MKDKQSLMTPIIILSGPGYLLLGMAIITR